MQKSTPLSLCSRNTSLKNLGVLIKSTCFSLLLFTGTHLQAQCGGIAKNGSIASDLGTGPGLVAWTSPANAQISDDIRSSASTTITAGSPGKTHFLNWRNFGYSIPGSASICGIVVAIEHRKTGKFSPSLLDYSVQLTNGSFSSANYAKTSIVWGDTDEVFVYGSETDTWGVSWTPSDVNQNAFGLNLVAQMTVGTGTTTAAAEVDNAYIIIYTNAVLPVELTAFDAKKNLSGEVRVDWTTATETNNNYFIVERSKNAMDFEAVTRVKGAGTSLQTRTYSITDAHPLTGISYYRLKQVDLNGEEKVFPIAQVYVGNKWEVDLVSQPGTLLIHVPQNDASTQVDLINFNGERMWTFQRDGNSGDEEIRIDVTNVPPGLYIIKAISGTEQFCAKTLLAKE
jgi:hypothetical protein